MEPKRQIVVFKGWEGFADRLQVLSDCIHYCIKNDAALCVDWRDYMWGQNNEDFSDYFDILHIPIIQLADVVTFLENGSSIMPELWTPELLKEPPSEIIHFGKFRLKFDNYAKVNSDIVVVNGKGVRTWHVDNLVNNIKIKDELVPTIISRLCALKLPYTIIHLRGTDRFSPEALKTTTLEYEGLSQEIKERVYVVSDMKELLESWTAKYPTTLKIEENQSIFKLPSGPQGTHTYEQEILKIYGLTKRELNINTLVDFLAISYANWTYGNKASLFISMGRMMRQAGVQCISKWLNGFIPPEESL